jgi:hypothetical protein
MLVALCGAVTLRFFALREERAARVFEYKVMTGICRPKEDEV